LNELRARGRLTRDDRTQPGAGGPSQLIQKEFLMDINYTALNTRVRTAITAHLLNERALQPDADLPEVSKDITEVVFAALEAGGLTEQFITENWKPAVLTATKR
jgi:hypothetical protein